MTVKITVDLTEFKRFTKKAPGIMDDLVKESFTRGSAKMRKEFIKTVDRGSWAELQETAEYKSKYNKPLQVMKSLIRYRVTGGYKRVTATIGVFTGKAGRDTLSNTKFRSKFGVTVNRFAKLMTYGGNLRISPSSRRLFIRRGFHISSRTNVIRFPKRDWYTPTRWKSPNVIIPYINKDLNERVKRRLQHGKF